MTNATKISVPPNTARYNGRVLCIVGRTQLCGEGFADNRFFRRETGTHAESRMEKGDVEWRGETAGEHTYGFLKRAVGESRERENHKA